MTYDRLEEVNLLLNFSSLALTNLINDKGVCITAPATPVLLDRQCCTGLGHSKCQKTPKLYHLLKSYGDFAEKVDYAYWWSCIWIGLRLQSMQQACFLALARLISISDF